ncbi:cubilin-like [Gigantopelta aegis]|uniref:cubilin-like n=1 Tax=Gigantopelta aegis TaxID=1735272 RepID=UPI001B8881B0|nr:cubilin-like [Gigantopelta aegis]
MQHVWGVNFVIVGIVIACILQCVQVKAQCGGNPLVITQEPSKSSYIQSPNYPLNYTENTSCEWKVKANSKTYDDDYLKFEVVDFVLMGNSGCTTDYLEIIAETRSTDPENVVKKNVGRWCGKQYSKYLEIPGDVTITFRSDASNTSTGFQIKIDLIKSSDVCNSMVRINTTMPIHAGHIVAVQEFGPTEGYLYSPGYPFGLYREMTCVWEVGIPAAKYLYAGTIHLENSLLEKPAESTASSKSPGDIHIKENWEGGKEYRYRIDEYFFFRSSSEYYMDKTITITFNRTSHSPKYEPGFRLLVYSRIPYKTSCYQNVLTADPEPSFVDHRVTRYNFAHCHWMISSGRYIGGDASRVVVIEVLVMDFDWSTVDSCNKVFTVEDENRTLIYDHKCKTRTKSDTPIRIRSYGLRIFVQFDIDTKLNRILFKYYSRNRYDYSENPMEAVENQSYMWLVAPSVLKEWITEPIRWLFTTRRPGKCIEVEIINMTDTKQYFRAFDGIDESADEILMCPYRDQWGLQPGAGIVSSTGSSLLVIVNTVNEPVDEPALITYSVTDNCGADIIELSPAKTTVQTVKVDIIKPHQNILCRWKIPSDGPQVEIRSSTHLAPASCADNFLAAYTSFSPERVIGKWCSSNDSVVSVRNHTYLKLQVAEMASGHFQAEYFNIERTSSCCADHSVIQLTTGSDFYLSSANHPAYYPMNCDCTWYIRAANPNEVVSLHVEEFELQTAPPSGKCVDKLAVYQGNDRREANLMTIMCGRGADDKRTFLTSEQNMTLHFLTDDQMSAKGFKLRLKSLSANYTNTAWNTELKVQTKSLYIVYIGSSVKCAGVCTWTLHSPADHVTHIEVIHLQIPCTEQYIEIVDVTDSQNHPSYGKLCGGTSDKVTSSGIKFNISFHVGGPDTHIMMRIKYYAEPKFVDNPCNNMTFKLNALHDIPKIITSPLHPQNYQNNLLCRWELHTEAKDMVIKLVTTQSHIEFTDDCIGDHVEIYDGDNTSSPRLSRWCATDAPTYHSTGQSLLVIFRTDFAVGDTGFKISYMAIDKPQSGLSTPTIYGIILAVVLLVIIICASVWIARKKKHGRHRGSSLNVKYQTPVT